MKNLKLRDIKWHVQIYKIVGDRVETRIQVSIFWFSDYFIILYHFYYVKSMILLTYLF